MTELYVNADWSALVPAGSAEAAFGIQEKHAKRLGLLPLAAAEELEEAPEVMVSANLLPPPEPKEAPQPDDKMVRKPSDKAAAKPKKK